MNQEVTNKCLHCSSQLPRRVNSTICRNCRFKGHKEFGSCLLCGAEQTIRQLSTVLRVNESIGSADKIIN